MKPLLEPVCVSCGISLPTGTDLHGPAAGRCTGCVARPLQDVDGVRAAVSYDALARRFVLRAKFGLRREIFRAFGILTARLLTVTGFGLDATVVIPVPAHPWSLLRRGFNPSEEIAAPIARRLGAPMRAARIARRWTGPGSVKRLAAAERRSALRRAFRPVGRLDGEHVLVVDDVLTTGATAEACAGAAKRAGARTVRIAVWARTPLSG